MLELSSGQLSPEELPATDGVQIDSTTDEQPQSSEAREKRAGSTITLEIIDNLENPEHLRAIEEVAALDAELFGRHKSLSAEDFTSIMKNGATIIAHRAEDGKLVSEASLIFNKDTNGSSTLERGLPDELAYCDGAAVSKNYRGKGLQRELLAERERIAKEAGKEGITASVRQRNVASIRSMLNRGFVMISDAPGYYGDDPEDDRVIMLKRFDVPNYMEELRSDHEALDEGEAGVLLPDEIIARVAEEPPLISLSIEQSDDIDTKTNHAMATLLNSGYIAVSCHDIDIGDSDGERSSALTFVRIDSLPRGYAGSLEDTRQKIGQVVNPGL